MTATTGRALRAAFLLVAVLVAVPALGQDPRASVVRNAARDWLALTDKLDAPASLAAAGARFREPIDAETWARSLQGARAPLGPVLQRTMAESSFERAKLGPGPEADIAMVLYRTSFANRTVATETVTLELEKDGTWRVIGYLIQ